MGDRWKEVPLGSLADVFDGPHATPTKTDNGPWYLSISSLSNGGVDLSKSARLAYDDFAKWTRRVQPRRGDTLFSYETRLGTAGYWAIDEPAALGRRMGLLRPKSDVVDPHFLTYAYLGPQFQAEIKKRAVQGATVDRILIAELGSWPIAVPPLTEQRRIAEVLGALDDLIDTNRKLGDNIEAILSREFSIAGFDDDSGSDAVELHDVLDVNPKYPKPRGIAPYIDMAALPIASARILEVDSREARGGARFMNGDTLLARITPCLENGKTGYVDGLNADEIGIGSTEFVVLSSSGDLGTHWSYFLARSSRFRDYAIQNMTGTSGRQRCSADAIERYRIARPRTDAARGFAAAAGRLFPALKELDEEAQIAGRARDELLPLLVSGRVRVSEVAL